MLDCARQNYTFGDIIRYIDLLAETKYSFIHLHLTDNHNVAVECRSLGQTLEFADEHDGYYVNRFNGRRFFSFAQIRELFSYATSRNIEFVVEIDFPAHMKGFFDLAQFKYGDKILKKIGAVITDDNDGNQFGSINLDNADGVKFIYSLVDEYTEQFDYIKYFHIGYDEYGGVVSVERKIDFLNEIASYIREKCFIVRMWNDTVTKDNINNIDNRIEVVYWKLLAAEYATIPDLQNHDFKVVNANMHYLYFYDWFIDETEYRTDRITESWDISVWNEFFYDKCATTENILGSMICVWAEEAVYHNSNDKNYDTAASMYRAMVRKNEAL